MMVLAAGVALLLAATDADVYVARGDMLVIAGTPVLLRGIDLPNGNRTLAQDAREEMLEIVRDSVVSCRLNGEKLHNHMLGNCTAGGEDIAAALVARGVALDCERYSQGQYRDLEPEGSRDRLQASSYCQN